MTNLQLYLALGIPTLAIVTSLIISLIQISAIRDDVREIRREAREDRARVDTKLNLLTGKVYELMGQK